MSIKTCILTNKDFTLLEAMRERYRGTGDPLDLILKRKIDSAVVMFHNDVPAEVATLNSRVTFSVDGRDSDTRVISPDRSATPVGMSLPITNARGLALLGLTEGQEFILSNRQSGEERIVLEKIHYQPEAAKREKEALERPVISPLRKPALRLIRGSLDAPLPFASQRHNGCDDPGPSVA